MKDKLIIRLSKRDKSMYKELAEKEKMSVSALVRNTMNKRIKGQLKVGVKSVLFMFLG